MEYVGVDASNKCRDADLQEHSSEVTRSPAEGMPVEHALEPSRKRHKASRLKRPQNVGLLPVKSSRHSEALRLSGLSRHSQCVRTQTRLYESVDGAPRTPAGSETRILTTHLPACDRRCRASSAAGDHVNLIRGRDGMSSLFQLCFSMPEHASKRVFDAISSTITRSLVF